jgi:hypothetical protein
MAAKVQDIAFEAEFDDEAQRVADIVEGLPEDERNVLIGKASESLRSELVGLEYARNLSPTEKLRNMGDTIYSDLMEQGHFYRSSSDSFSRVFWYEYYRNTLWEITTEHFKRHFFWRYDLGTTTQLGKAVIDRVITRCSQEGTTTAVYNFSHYDTERNILYKFDNVNQVFKLNGETIEIVPNGTDKVLFVKEAEGEKIEPIENGEKYLNAKLFDNINFDDSESTLDCIEQYELFRHWFFSIFFGELLETRPLCLLWGIKGSGKTFLFEMIKKIVTGKDSHVESITLKKDFVSCLANSYFIALDNVDSFIRWLEDMLSKCATGTTITLRKLYTTSDVVRIKPNVFIGLTARTPEFRRDDVADRLLIFKVKRFERFLSKSELTNDILSHRGEMWHDIFLELNKIVKLLGQNKLRGLRSTFRLADFYVFVRRQMTSKDDIKFCESIFSKMADAQNEFALEDQSIFHALVSYFEDKTGYEAHTTGDWFRILGEQAEQNNTWWYKTAISFGKRLKNLKTELSRYFDINTEPGAARTTIYIISKK